MKEKYLKELKSGSLCQLSTMACFKTSKDDLDHNGIALCALEKIMRYGSYCEAAVALDLFMDYSYAKNELEACNIGKNVASAAS